MPALIPRDATGAHTLLLRESLRAAGWRSEIFTEATHDELIGQSHRAQDYPAWSAPGDILVYQLSTSSMVAELLAERPEPLVIDYHNITGAEHYAHWEPVIAKRSADAVEQLSVLAPRAALGLAHSEFSESDLIAAGCRETRVVPVLADHRRLSRSPDAALLRRLSELKDRGGSDWLFVGRIVPSKAQHELVKALWAYRRLYDRFARLHLVGSAASPPYARSLRAFIDELGLDEAVVLHGDAPDGALAALLKAADVFVSLSVHEGFGVPLVEAMAAGLPVVALGRGAVTSTVGDAGLVLDRSTPALVAAAVHRVLAGGELRDRLMAAGRRRADLYSLERGAQTTIRAITAIEERHDAATSGPTIRNGAPSGERHSTGSEELSTQ